MKSSHPKTSHGVQFAAEMFINCLVELKQEPDCEQIFHQLVFAFIISARLIAEALVKELRAAAIKLLKTI